MALGVPGAMGLMTNARCRDLIRAAGIDLNPMSGVPGTYYTIDREADLRRLVILILCERAESGPWNDTLDIDSPIR